MGLADQTTKRVLSYDANQLIDTEFVWKVLCAASAGDGKTHFGLSILWYLTKELKLPLATIRICYLDLDGGLSPLIKRLVLNQTITPEEVSRIKYYPCRDFEQILESTEDAYAVLDIHKQEFGVLGTWIIVDNLEKAWEWSRELYSITAYGQEITDRMMEARKTQIFAKRAGSGAKGEAIFNQQLDYGVINPLHNRWSGRFPLSGFNFVWLSPWKVDEKTKEWRYGQKQNEQKVDYTFFKYRIAKGEPVQGDIIKSRSTETLIKQIKNPDFTGFVRAIRDQEEKEKNKNIIAKEVSAIW